MIALYAAALRPEAVLSLTLSEPGTLQLAGTPEAAEMIANGERLYGAADSITPLDFVRMFRFGANSARETPAELPESLRRGAELAMRERPPWEGEGAAPPPRRGGLPGACRLRRALSRVRGRLRPAGRGTGGRASDDRRQGPQRPRDRRPLQPVSWRGSSLRIRCPDGDRDRRARRGRQVHGRARVAAEIGFTYLDSGAMYRCVALAALGRGADLDDGDARRCPGRGGPRSTSRDSACCSTAKTSARRSASRTSPPPPPRSRSTRGCGRRWSSASGELIAAGRYVAEGRDIGTVVSPDSPLKIFLTASDEERARRRAAADRRAGRRRSSRRSANRDARDIEREHGALRAAEDAVELDTTGFSPLNEVVARVVALVRERGLA